MAELRPRSKHERWDLDSNPDYEQRREMLASGDMVAAEEERKGGRVVYHGVFLPRQILGGSQAAAIVCHDDHPTLGEALDCAAALGELLPIVIEPATGGPES